MISLHLTLYQHFRCEYSLKSKFSFGNLDFSSQVNVIYRLIIESSRWLGIDKAVLLHPIIRPPPNAGFYYGHGREKTVFGRRFERI